MIAAPAQAADIPSFVAKCVEKEIRSVGRNASDGKTIASHTIEPTIDMPGRLMQRESFAYRQGDDYVEHLSADTKAKIVGRTSHTLVIIDTDLPSSTAASARIYVINTKLKQVIEARAAGTDTFGSGLSAATVEMACDFTDQGPR